MNSITFISTKHKEIGICNAEELYKIIEKIRPEVIFLEAIGNTYSDYEKFCFSTYGVHHRKLEIAAIQKYSYNNSFEYVPVCDDGLSHDYERKSQIIGENREWKKLIDNFNFLTETKGFEFLNSIESIKLHENIRELENHILKDNTEVETAFNTYIDKYESSMISNIYSYGKNNHFSSAIFMCGSAHRKSIIEKIEKAKVQEEVNLNWIVFDN